VSWAPRPSARREGLRCRLPSVTRRGREGWGPGRRRHGGHTGRSRVRDGSVPHFPCSAFRPRSVAARAGAGPIHAGRVPTRVGRGRLGARPAQLPAPRGAELEARTPGSESHPQPGVQALRGPGRGRRSGCPQGERTRI
jgi:hypothetical protein